jgi:hypothetical protein
MNLPGTLNSHNAGLRLDSPEIAIDEEIGRVLI